MDGMTDRDEPPTNPANMDGQDFSPILNILPIHA